MTALRGLGVACSAWLVLGACGGTGDASGFVDDAPEVAAMVALPDGGLRFGERLTGVVREVGPGGRALGEPVARVEVSTGGQRGLLGLAVDAQGRTFASWTDPEGRIAVGQVAPGPTRIVWRGPESQDRANGGHLELTADGDLLVGVGNLLDSTRADDRTVPNGKLLILDPDGAPDQSYEILSVGWNNPYAFDVGAQGEVWVADNAPPGPERIARGDLDEPAVVTELEGTRAPSGLAILSSGRVAVCGFVSEELEVFGVAERGQAESTGVLAGDCSLGVVELSDGRLAYSTGTSIRVVRP